MVIAALAYKFIVAGSVEKAEDGRTAIVLEAAAAAARRMGMDAAHTAPAPMVGKLPLQFKTLGFGVHRDFDTIAVDAESLGDPKHTLTQWAGALQKCVVCHGTYQIKLVSER